MKNVIDVAVNMAARLEYAEWLMENGGRRESQRIIRQVARAACGNNNNNNKQKRKEGTCEV